MNEQGYVYDYPVRLVSKEGQLIDVLLHVTKIRVNERELYHTICQDLTIQKKTEARLRETADSYTGLFNSVSDAIYILNEEGIFIDVNEGAVKMYGYPREVLIGKSPAFVSAEGMNDMTEISRKVLNAFCGEFQQFEFWGKRANGEAFLKDVRITNGQYYGKPVAIAMAIDITYRKRMEVELIASENRLKSIFRAAPAGIGLMSGDRTILDVNPYCCELLGYSLDEMVGRNASFLYPDQHEYEKVGDVKYKMMALTGTGIIETQWKHKEGKVIDILLSSTLLDPDDITQGVTFTALDICQLKEVQTELSKKASELEKFNNLMVGRELRMIDLKKEINDLYMAAGKGPKYFIPENPYEGIEPYTSR
jgi:PAS domain S-box-containing protein